MVYFVRLSLIATFFFGQRHNKACRTPTPMTKQLKNQPIFEWIRAESNELGNDTTQIRRHRRWSAVHSMRPHRIPTTKRHCHRPNSHAPYQKPESTENHFKSDHFHEWLMQSVAKAVTGNCMVYYHRHVSKPPHADNVKHWKQTASDAACLQCGDRYWLALRARRWWLWWRSRQAIEREWLCGAFDGNGIYEWANHQVIWLFSMVPNLVTPKCAENVQRGSPTKR